MDENSDLLNQLSEPTLIFEDNQLAICMAKNPQFYGRSKHINIKFHFIREQVRANKIQLKYCASGDTLADLLTKGISTEKLERLRKLYGMCSCVSSEECGSNVLSTN